jgi:hypothetical protein
MQTPTEQVEKLRQKVEKLINLHRLLLQENHQLKAEKEKLTDTIRQRDNQLDDLGEKLKVIRLARQVTGSDQNTRDLKLKINEYIREIDRCLALINH